MTGPVRQNPNKRAYFAAFQRIASEFVAPRTPAVIWVVLVSLIAVALETIGILVIVPVLSAELGGAGHFASWVSDALSAIGAETRNTRVLLMLGLAVAIAIVRGVVLWRRDVAMAAVTMDFVNDWRKRLIGKIGAASWPSVVSSSKLGLHHALVDDSLRLEIAGYSVIHSVVIAILLTVQLAAALYLAPVLTILVLLLLVGVALLMRPFMVEANRLGHETLDVNKGLFGQTEAFLAGLKQARVEGRQHAFVNDLEGGLADQKGIAIRSAQQAGRLALWYSVGVTAIIALVLALGLVVFDLSTPVLVTVLVLYARIAGPVQSLLSEAQAFTQNLSAFDNIQALMMRLTPETADMAPITHRGKGLIDLEQVAYRYPADQNNVFDDLTVNINPGEKIALMGASGRGKTTLLDCLAGLIPPSHGQISIAGKAPQEAFGKNGLALAYLVQTPAVTEARLRDHLTLGSQGTVPDANLWEALELVSLAERIKGLEDGLDHVLTYGSDGLSGGELQRLMLARVFLAPPDILFLDEATNAMDRELERRILWALSQKMPETTVIAVSHRTTLADWADRVIDLDL